MTVMSAAIAPVAAGHAEAVVVTSASPLWYTTRATGLVAMVLLTISMAAGLLSSAATSGPACRGSSRSACTGTPRCWPWPSRPCTS